MQGETIINMGSATAIGDGVAGLPWLGVNVLLAVASYRVGRALFRDGGPAIRSMASITIFLAAILLSTILLGTSGLLRPWILIGLVAVAAATMLSAVARRDAIAVDVNRRSRHRQTRPVIFALWGILAAFGVAHTAMSGLIEFPSGFDSLMYHLPIIDQWIQAESLYAPNSSYWWTPGIGEVIGLWMVAPFSGDFLAALNNVPFVALWALGSYCLARELRLPRVWSHLAAMASLLTYSTLDELNDGQNDIAIVAFFLTGAAFGLRFLSSGRNAELFLFAIAVGALCGVKYNALGYAALLIVSVVGLCVIYRGVRAAAKSLAAAILGVLSFSGYWYVRNWIIGGSPIFPMGIGHDIATAYPDVWSTTFLGNKDACVPGLAVDALWRMTGPVHFAAIMATPALLVYFFARTLVIKIPGDDCSRESLTSLFMAIVLCGSCALLLITPFCLEDESGSLNHLKWAYTPARYGLCFLSSAVLVFARFVFELWRLRGSWWNWFCRSTEAIPGKRYFARTFGCRKADLVPILGFLGLLVWQLVLRIRHSWHQFNFADTGLVAMNLLLVGTIFWFLLSSRSKGVRWSTFIVTCGLGAGAIALLSTRWHDGFGPHYDKMFRTSVFSQASTGDAIWHDRIGVLEMRAYPFFGSRRQTEVFRPRVLESQDALAEYVQTHDLRYVATHTGQRREYYLYADTFNWLQNAPRQYTLIHNRGRHAIFMVRRSTPGGRSASEAARPKAK